MIYFYNNRFVPNYLVEKEPYRTLIGRLVVSYYYWILKNSNVDNIRLVNRVEDIEDHSSNWVFFHYSGYRTISRLKYVRRAQFVNDRPIIPQCDAYFVVLPEEHNSKTRFLHHPLPVDIQSCRPKFPPKIFTCISNKGTVDPSVILAAAALEKKYSITIRFQYRDWFNKGDEDVYFFVRVKEEGIDHKSMNRLLIATCMGVPAILSDEVSFKGAPYSLNYACANNCQEFIDSVEILLNDERRFRELINPRYPVREDVNRQIVDTISQLQ